MEIEIEKIKIEQGDFEAVMTIKGELQKVMGGNWDLQRAINDKLAEMVVKEWLEKHAQEVLVAVNVPAVANLVALKAANIIK